MTRRLHIHLNIMHKYNRPRLWYFNSAVHIIYSLTAQVPIHFHYINRAARIFFKNTHFAFHTRPKVSKCWQNFSFLVNNAFKGQMVKEERENRTRKALPSHTGRLSLNTVIFGNKHLKTDLSYCFPQVLHYHNGFSLQRGIKAWRHIPNSTQMQLVMHIIPAQHIRCHY